MSGLWHVAKFSVPVNEINDISDGVLREHYLRKTFLGEVLSQILSELSKLDSGKEGGFRTIMYMHRFNENTVSTVRTEYIQELRYKYEDERIPFAIDILFSNKFNF